MQTTSRATQTSHPSSSEWEAHTSLAAELERAKEELEIISYVASHDLQAPLRNIIFACEELNTKQSLSLDKPGQEALQRITNEAARMKTLMQGMLDYLRLETFGPAHSLLDSNEILGVAHTILEEKIQNTGAQIQSDALPPIYGHRGRLTRLFVNLIDNALKFHSQEQPVIHISARGTDEGWEFCVEDNGIGIDEEYNDIIFGLFQRLHTADAYPGDGIGLALSRKIVESHGGKLWVEATPGVGSRFKFTLPISKNT